MRGFQIKKRVTRFMHKRRTGSGLFGWVKKKTKELLKKCGSGSGLGYERLNRIGVPKGHLAVYVGQKEDDCCRVLVPIFYFNHPLFGRLLNEAEEKFGFEYPGRIMIPCRVSEFESVTKKIRATR